MVLERDYPQLPPQELNEEFHKLFGAISARPISMLGTIMDDDSLEMTDEEQAEYDKTLETLRQDYELTDKIFGMHRQFRNLDEVEATLDDSLRSILIGQAKGDVAREKRAKSFYSAAIMVKLGGLMPYVRGTDSFKDYIRREIGRYIMEGISDGGKGHWLYGDEQGGIFADESVEGIEERSIQIFSADINWYGLDPLMIMGRMFEADYDNDPNYRGMVDLGRKWKQEFNEKYGRQPVDVYSQEIKIP